MQPGAPHLPSDMRDALAPESGHTRRSALIFLLITVMIDSIGIGVIVPMLPTLVSELGHTDLAGAAVYGGWLTAVFLFGTTGKTWKVKAGLADRDFVRVNPGDSASVTFDAWPGVRFPAVIEQVGELADQLTGTYEADLAVSDVGYKLAAGFIAGADIYPMKKERYTLVPVESMVEADGLAGYVFTVMDNNIVTKTRVQIAAIIGSEAALKDFDDRNNMVVTEGASYIRDGDEVRILK